MSQTPFRRRDFLRSLAATVVVAGPVACGDDSTVQPFPPGGGGGSGGSGPTPPSTAEVFPQSVLSGDPRPDSVILWTRVEPEAGSAADVPVEYVVATDEALTQVVAQGTFTAKAESDHTVKLKVTGLTQPGTHYYYQFSARGATSRLGRTKTAPAEGADVPLRFAFASCQDFIGRYYHSWKALLDEAGEEGKDLDLVVYLGDYIYETTGNPMFQSPDPTRRVDLPVGRTLGEGAGAYKTAVEVEDYRALYRAYRADKNLQAVHERFPFVVIWDDHEFADDSASDRTADLDNATGTGPGQEERDPMRRLKATRAWVEYQPVDVPQQAAGEPFSQFKMYRRLRFGKHVEFFMTDQRLYRDGPVIPEGPIDEDVAKLSSNTSLGSHYFLLKTGTREVMGQPPVTIGFDVREAAVKPKMLGDAQKQWFLEGVKGSTATWKVWGNEVQLWQMALDLSPYTTIPAQYRGLFYFTVDQWDGFRTERAEVLTALTGVPNLVAITGDIHGFFGAELHPDFDAATLGTPVAAEFVVGGISSQSVRSIIRETVNSDPVLKLLQLNPLVDTLDTVLTTTNRHLKYANSDAYGVAIADVSATAFEVTFLQLDDITQPTFAGEIKRTTLRCQAGSSAVTEVTTLAAPGAPAARPATRAPGGIGREGLASVDVDADGVLDVALRAGELDRRHPAERPGVDPRLEHEVARHLVRALEQFVGAALGHDPAANEQEGPVRDAKGARHVVADDHVGHAEALAGLFDEVVDHARGERVQP